MTAVDVAERKSRYRAVSFYFLAVMSLLILWLSMARPDSHLLRGLWAGLSFAAAANLLPLARWLKPHSAVARLLDDDDGVREHRRMSCTAGFWAAVVSSLVVSAAVELAASIGAFDTVRIVATAAIAAALISFVTLELRAARG